MDSSHGTVIVAPLCPLPLPRLRNGRYFMHWAALCPLQIYGLVHEVGITFSYVGNRLWHMLYAIRHGWLKYMIMLL